MKSNRRDILIGAAILVIIILAIYLIRRPAIFNTVTVSPVPSAISEFEQKLEDQFNIKVPDNVEKIELKDVTGGISQGIATRIYENNVFEHTVIADLTDPDSGYFYQGWLMRGNPGDTNFGYVSTGKLESEKGGYMVNIRVNKDLRDYKKVVVTLERVADNTPEKHILEGSFQ